MDTIYKQRVYTVKAKNSAGKATQQIEILAQDATELRSFMFEPIDQHKARILSHKEAS